MQIENISDQTITLEWSPSWNSDDPTVTAWEFDQVVQSLGLVGGLTILPGQALDVPDNLGLVLAENTAGIGVVIETYASFADTDPYPGEYDLAETPLKVEAVVVCVDYADFLAETLPLNKHHFDQLVVVTTPEDVETQRLCEVHYVKCVTTHAFGTQRGQFSKGAGINVGLRELDLDGWVVHLDADVALPPLFRRVLQLKHLHHGLDEASVYGCDRYMLPDRRAWERQKRHPRLSHEDNVWLHADAWPIGTRIVSTDRHYGGYVPIGFMQLWNPTGSGVRRYPENHSTAGKTDMLFSGLFKPDHRRFLPDFIVYHLQSDASAENGANWGGRKTKSFSQVSVWWAIIDWWCWWTWWNWHERRKRKRHHHNPLPPPPPPYSE